MWWRRSSRVRTSRPACWTPALKVGGCVEPPLSVRSILSNYLDKSATQPVYLEECSIVVLSKVSYSSKRGKQSCCQYAIIFRSPSNWRLLTTRIVHEGVGAPRTDQMLPQLCFRGRPASVRRSWGEHSPGKPPPSHQVSPAYAPK